jgi:hypothetical protein
LHGGHAAHDAFFALASCRTASEAKRHNWRLAPHAAGLPPRIARAIGAGTVPAEHPGVLRSQIDEKVKKAARLSAPSDEELARAEDENMTAPEVSDDNA